MSALRPCLALMLLTAGCLRQAHLPPPPTPAELAPAPGFAPRVAEEGLSGPGATHADAPALAKSGEPSSAIGPLPGGEACLGELARLGVSFTRREAELGVPTPVLVRGEIGGVRLFSDAMPLVADCRLILALSELAPGLARLGVTQMRFSGAYVYRTKRSGRLSLHAHGLAIDIHDVWFGSERLSVKKDFVRGQGRACKPEMAPLNRLACEVRAERVFKELLTPDDNADHHDHFHFGLAPLSGEIPADLPPPIVLRKPVRKAPPVEAEADVLPPLDDGVPAARQDHAPVEIPGLLPD